MLNLLKSKLRKKPVKNAALLNRGEEDFRVRNAQFVSFLSESGFRRRALDSHDKGKRIRRFVTFAFMWSLIIGFSWVVIESAEALELF
ncbi:hypothetical protein MLD52_20210 [Puniceicoccaceae bacterium K14]|nr:hypothetical protein [Puniceicoccaceae bacterium K14]